MTEDTLKERMAALEAQRRQMEANLNAIAGAMQECQFWLSKLQTPEIQDGKSTV
jgi:prefoldin subunit 5